MQGDLSLPVAAMPTEIRCSVDSASTSSLPCIFAILWEPWCVGCPLKNQKADSFHHTVRTPDQIDTRFVMCVSTFLDGLASLAVPLQHIGLQRSKHHITRAALCTVCRRRSLHCQEKCYKCIRVC